MLKYFAQNYFENSFLIYKKYQILMKIIMTEKLEIEFYTWVKNYLYIKLL